MGLIGLRVLGFLGFRDPEFSRLPQKTAGEGGILLTEGHSAKTHSVQMLGLPNLQPVRRRNLVLKPWFQSELATHELKSLQQAAKQLSVADLNELACESRLPRSYVVLGRPLKGDPSEPYFWLS